MYKIQRTMLVVLLLLLIMIAGEIVALLPHVLEQAAR